MTSTAKRKSLLLPIFLIVLVDILGLTLLIPLLPFYAEHFGASPAVVGLLITTYAFCQLFSGPLLGKISDRVGRKPLLLLSQLGTFIGFLVLAFANTLGLVFLSRVIDGVTAGNLSLAQAYISDVTEAKDRAKSLAIIGISFGVGFLIGPAISGFLSQYGLQYPIFASAGLSMTSILATYFLLPNKEELQRLLLERRAESLAAERSEPQATEASPGASKEKSYGRLSVLDWGTYAGYFKRPGLSQSLTQFLFFILAFALFTSGFALFSERRFTTAAGFHYGPKEVGYLFAYSGFLGMVVQGGLLGRLVRRFGEEKLVIAGFTGTALGYAMLGFSYHLPELIVTTTVTALGSALLRPSITSIVTQRAGRHEQGVVLGLTQSLASLSNIIAPMMAGFLIDRSWLAAWAVLAACVSLVGLLVSVKVSSPARPSETPA